MLAMQYTIQLPMDYDMRLIDKRVAERKPLFDKVPGLVHKSYLADDEDKLYAPFYIWNDVAKLRDFLLDDLFHGVTTAFHRPRVRSWSVLEYENGQFKGAPTFALRESDPIPADIPLEEVMEQARAHQQELLDSKGLHTTVLGLDADRWELLHYSLWDSAESPPQTHSDCCHRYRVVNP